MYKYNKFNFRASCEARDNSPTYHYWAGPEKIESNNTCNVSGTLNLLAGSYKHSMLNLFSLK